MKRSDDRKNRTGIAFLLIFIALSAGILAGGYFAYRHYEQNYRTGVEQQLAAIAESKVDQLLQWRNERTADGQVFFRNDAFSVLVKQYLQNPNDQEAKRRILTWVGQVQRAYSYDLVMLFDAQFNTKLVFPENREQERLVIDQRNTDILLSGNTSFQDFYRNEQDGRVYLKILVPILDDHSPKRIIAVLALRIDPTQSLYPMIEKWPTRSKTSETLVVRREGNEVLFLNNLKFRNDAALILRIPLETKDVLAVKAALGVEGVVEGIDYRGEHVIGNVCAVPNSPWFLVARMDYSEVFAPLRERLWMMIILVGALLAGAGASVGLIWRYQRNRFYREQYKAAEALRETTEYLESLFNHANAPIIVWDPSLLILRFNHAFEQLTGYQEEEVKGKKIELLFPKDTIEHSLDLIHKAVGGEQWKTVEIEIRRKNGESKVVLWNSANILDKDGKSVVATIAQGHDITERKQIEKELRESEVKFRQTFELSPLGIVMVGLDKKFLHCNDAFARFLGCLPEELPGRTIEDITFAEDRHLGMTEMGAIVKGETKSSNVQKRYVRKDGQLVWGEVTISLVRDREEHPQYFLSIIQDITERKRNEAELRKLYEMSEHSRTALLSILEDQKQTEAALRESEQHLRRFYDSGLIGVIYWNIHGQITDANDKFLEMVGYTRDELEAARIDLANMTPPEYRHLDESSVAELEATGVNKTPFEKEYIRKDGTRVPIIIAGAMLDEARDNGVAFVLDITERKRVEEALRESQTLYHSFIEQLPNPVFRKDREGRYVLVNSQFCRLKGVRKEDFIGRKPMEIAATEFSTQGVEGQATKYANVGEEVHEQILRTGKISEAEEEYPAADGAILDMHVVRMPVFDSQGTIIGTQGIMFDISERKRAEEEIQKLNTELEKRVVDRTAQLEAANKELEAFSYSVSHDLRAPLRAVDGFSRIVLEEYAQKLDPEADRLLKVICASTQKMDELITDLLDLSRVSRNEMKSSRVAMTMLVESIYHEAASAEIRDKFSFSVGPIPDASCDPVLIKQVWRNLISNAIKFTMPKDKRTIEIGGRSEDGMNAFFIKDSGVGFDPRYSHKLFGMFQRLHKAEEFEGTGVGLAIVQRIIHRHGGKVWAEGKVGEGATFWFSLPNRQEEIGNSQ